MAKRRGIVGEFLDFMWQRKVFWMAPIILVLILLAFVVIAGGGAAAPFIYTLF